MNYSNYKFIDFGLSDKNTPMTSLIIIIMFIIHLLYAVTGLFNGSYCFNQYNISEYTQSSYFLKRLLTTYIHLSWSHLLSNSYGLLSLKSYEEIIGSQNFLKIIIMLTFLTISMEEIILNLINSSQRCSVGFSGVLLGLLVYSYKYDKTGTFYGHVMNKLGGVVLTIILTQITYPNASFIGHVVGALSGYILLKIY